MDYFDFKDRICVVTGGARGIGRCIVNEFLKRRAKVAFIDKDKSAGDQTLKSIQDNGFETLFFHGDIADKYVLEAFSAKVLEIYGGVDFLINNACLSRKGILSGCSYEDFTYVLSVGVTAPYMLAKLFYSHFREGAAIVNIASTRAFMSQADTESYTAAKGGILSLTHALSVSLAGKVRVNSICPGWIENHESNHSESDKNQHPVKRVGKPIDIARAVMFLCAGESGFITGENITIDGGITRLMIYSGDDGWSYEGK